MEIKIRYTCVKKSTTFSNVFTLEEIEHGHAAYWMRINIASSGEVYRDLHIGKKDASGNDIFNNDILDWGDNFPSKVYYDSDECAFRIEELGIKEGEFAPRTHDMESQTNPPKILGNVHINNQFQKS